MRLFPALSLGLTFLAGCSSGSSSTIELKLTSNQVTDPSSFETDYQVYNHRLYTCRDSPVEVGDQKTCSTMFLTDDINVSGLRDISIPGLEEGTYYIQVAFRKPSDCNSQTIGGSGTFYVTSQGSSHMTLTLQDQGPSCVMPF